MHDIHTRFQVRLDVTTILTVCPNSFKAVIDAVGSPIHTSIVDFPEGARARVISVEVHGRELVVATPHIHIGQLCDARCELPWRRAWAGLASCAFGIATLGECTTTKPHYDHRQRPLISHTMITPFPHWKQVVAFSSRLRP